jgi:hypothetical protein
MAAVTTISKEQGGTEAAAQGTEATNPQGTELKKVQDTELEKKIQEAKKLQVDLEMEKFYQEIYQENCQTDDEDGGSDNDDYFGKRADVDGLDDGGDFGNQSDCSFPSDDGGGCFSSDGFDEFCDDPRNGRGGWNVVM